MTNLLGAKRGLVVAGKIRILPEPSIKETADTLDPPILHEFDPRPDRFTGDGTVVWVAGTAGAMDNLFVRASWVKIIVHLITQA